MGVSDWFQAWLALIESPQEAPGNHRPTPEPFHQKQDGAEICRRPSSFTRVPAEVQYIPGTRYLWYWMDFSHRLQPSMATRFRVMDHFACHSVLPWTQNIPVIFSTLLPFILSLGETRPRNHHQRPHCQKDYERLKAFTFLFYPCAFSFVISRSCWSAVICCVGRYWAIAVMEYDCHLRGDIFRHRHWATTDSTERTGRRAPWPGGRLARSGRSYPETRQHALTVN